jgi:hypothetical protein
VNIHLDDGDARRVAGPISLLLDDLEAHAAALGQRQPAATGGAA